MQKVSSQIYSRLQITYLIGSVAIIILYLTLLLGQFLGPGELLGTSPLNLGIAIIHMVYFALIRLWINEKSPLMATAIDMGLFSLNIAILIMTTGGFASAYFAFWLMIILSSAVLGIRALSIYISITAILLFISSLIATNPWEYLLDNMVFLIAAAVAGYLGLWLWRNHPQEDGGDSQVTQLSQKLEVEQTKSDILLRSIGDGVVVTDYDGVIQLFNGPACIITGWPQEEVIGINYQNVITLEDEDGNPIDENHNPFKRAMKTKSSIRSNDFLILNRAKRKIHLSIVVSPIFSKDNQVAGSIGVFRDISAEKEAARQRDEFISTASHEMRTPVAAIEGFLSLAMNDQVAKVDENAKKYITKAYESTRHLGKLFQDLLSITKVEDGRLANHPEPFEMSKLVHSVIDELSFEAEEKGLKLKLKASNDKTAVAHNQVLPLFFVNADPERIREVLTNLVDNGIKFTPKGEVSISITGDDKYVTVGVHDQGIGIPEDEVTHLFQKFYRVDSTATREIGGTGLGLYLARTIIELYQGRIWVESKEGEGSHFFFMLPRLTQEQAHKIETQLEKQAKGENVEAEPGDIVAPTSTSTVE
ncbi:MAG: ATP-binding protein [Candidatus Saccharimonadales bacterium]